MRFSTIHPATPLFLALPLVQGCQAAISLWGNLAMLALSVGIFCATVLLRAPG